MGAHYRALSTGGSIIVPIKAIAAGETGEGTDFIVSLALRRFLPFGRLLWSGGWAKRPPGMNQLPTLAATAKPRPMQRRMPSTADFPRLAMGWRRSLPAWRPSFFLVRLRADFMDATPNMDFM